MPSTFKQSTTMSQPLGWDIFVMVFGLLILPALAYFFSKVVEHSSISQSPHWQVLVLLALYVS